MRGADGREPFRWVVSAWWAVAARSSGGLGPAGDGRAEESLASDWAGDGSSLWIRSCPARSARVTEDHRRRAGRANAESSSAPSR